MAVNATQNIKYLTRLPSILSVVLAAFVSHVYFTCIVGFTETLVPWSP